MEDVGDVKKQKDHTAKDLEDVAVEELFPGIGLDDLPEKIENAVWGAIKREAKATKAKKLKASHDNKNLDTKTKGNVVTKAKLNRSKTEKIKGKQKEHDTSKAVKGKETKVGTPKITSKQK